MNLKRQRFALIIVHEVLLDKHFVSSILVYLAQTLICVVYSLKLGCGSEVLK